MAGRDPQDANSSRPGHVFRHVNINDSGRAHLGDTYKISGLPPESAAKPER